MFLPEDLDVVKRPAVVALGREFNFRFSHANLDHYCWLGTDEYVDRHGHAGFCVWLIKDSRGWFAEWNDVRFSGASPDEVVGELQTFLYDQFDRLASAKQSWESSKRST